MAMLSEHTLEGWLEGYLLTGRHGLLSSYEAFIHVIDVLEVPIKLTRSSLINNLIFSI
jgi:phosphoketolase